MQNPSSSSPLVMRSYPILLWVFGGFFLVGSVFTLMQPDGLMPGLILLLFGVLLTFVLASVDTVTVDRMRGTLTIRNRTVFRNSVKEIPLRDIVSIEVNGTRGSRGGSTYRLEVVLNSGAIVPFTGFYSSGYAGKEKKAQALRDYLGLANVQPSPVFSPGLGNFQSPQPYSPDRMQNFQPSASFSSGQVLFGGRNFSPVKDGVTSGITWRVESSSFSGSAITRWVTNNVTSQGSFLCLMQKPKGSINLPGGLLGSLSDKLYEKILEMYGFTIDDLPAITIAKPLEGLDPRLAPHFATLASEVNWGRQMLNPWVVAALAGWAEQNPLHTVQASGGGSPGQLVVLLSPQGLYLAMLASPLPEVVESITRLGVDLAQAIK